MKEKLKAMYIKNQEVLINCFAISSMLLLIISIILLLVGLIISGIFGQSNFTQVMAIFFAFAGVLLMGYIQTKNVNKQIKNQIDISLNNNLIDKKENIIKELINLKKLLDVTHYFICTTILHSKELSSDNHDFFNKIGLDIPYLIKIEREGIKEYQKSLIEELSRMECHEDKTFKFISDKIDFELIHMLKALYFNEIINIDKINCIVSEDLCLKSLKMVLNNVKSAKESNYMNGIAIHMSIYNAAVQDIDEMIKNIIDFKTLQTNVI